MASALVPGRAIRIELNQDRLRAHGLTLEQALNDVDPVLQAHGLQRRYDTLYAGGGTVDAVRCVLAIQDVARRLAWFKPCVHDLRLLRIAEVSDLSIAL